MTKEIGNDVKGFLEKNLEGFAESHLEAWKDRYYKYSKKDLAFDLAVNHDISLEIERTEEGIGRKLTDSEYTYVSNQFNKAVVSQYHK